MTSEGSGSGTLFVRGALADLAKRVKFLKVYIKAGKLLVFVKYGGKPKSMFAPVK